MESASKIITLVSDLLSRCGGPLTGTFGGGSSFSVVRYTLMEQKSKLVDIYTTGGAAASVEAIHWNIPCFILFPFGGGGSKIHIFEWMKKKRLNACWPIYRIAGNFREVHIFAIFTTHDQNAKIRTAKYETAKI